MPTARPHQPRLHCMSVRQLDDFRPQFSLVLATTPSSGLATSMPEDRFFSTTASWQWQQVPLIHGYLSSPTSKHRGCGRYSNDSGGNSMDSACIRGRENSLTFTSDGHGEGSFDEYDEKARLERRSLATPGLRRTHDFLCLYSMACSGLYETPI